MKIMPPEKQKDVLFSLTQQLAVLWMITALSPWIIPTNQPTIDMQWEQELNLCYIKLFGFGACLLRQHYLT